jgi:hypothetical protein
METCTVETGLLRKKPCGEASVTHCDNCEQPLCAKHAIAQLTSAGRKSGKHLCKDCDAARREYDKRVGPEAAAAKPAKEPAATPAAKHANAPVAPANKPAAPASPAPAAGKPKEEDSLGGIDFTPGGGGDKK